MRNPRMNARSLILVTLFVALAGCESATAPEPEPEPALPELPAPTFSGLSAGAHHTCALHQDGRVFCWGRSLRGALGNDSLLVSLHAVQVTVSDPVTTLASGHDHVCVITGRGRAECWGSGAEGALGSGTAANRFSPTPVETPGRFLTTLAGGGAHTCAISLVEDGVPLGSSVGSTLPNLVCWGRGEEGQLAQSSTRVALTPTPVNRPIRGARVSLGQRHSCAIDHEGVLQCWGWNVYGQLGFGVTFNFDAPAPIVSSERFQAVAAGDEYTCAIDTSGQGWCWGRGDSGQLGTGAQTSHTLPQRVAGGLTFSALSASVEHTCGVTADGQAYCWGNNRFGQLGIGTEGGVYPTPQRVGGEASTLRFRAVTTGFLHSCGLTTEGTAFCWGYGGFGQLGTGTTLSFSTPTPLYLEGRIDP
jgi:alpha-tubulin suppressor-like RCC1 family protein